MKAAVFHAANQPMTIEVEAVDRALGARHHAVACGPFPPNPCQKTASTAAATRIAATTITRLTMTSDSLEQLKLIKVYHRQTL